MSAVNTARLAFYRICPMPIKVSIVGAEKSPPALPSALPGVYFSGRYSTGEAAVRDVSLNTPDLILVNFYLPCMDGFECVRRLKTLLSTMPVLMFSEATTTRSKNDALIFSALRAGTAGYLPENLPAPGWLDAIHQVHKAGQRDRVLFLIFFDSDRQLGNSARHWGKIARMLNSSAATVSYCGDWRKGGMAPRRLVPAITFSNETFPFKGNQAQAQLC